MGPKKDRDDAFDALADQAASEADDALGSREAALLAGTSVDLDSLRPQVSDKASFDALVVAVGESTRRNESIAQLQQRVQDMGKGALSVAKEVAAILPKL